MSEVMALALICFGASLLGAVAGGVLVWRLVRSHLAGHEEPHPVASRGPLEPPPPPGSSPAPIPRPEPVRREEALAPELTDEEVDAMLPELPAPSKSRKRLLAAPRKPTFHRL